MRFSSVVKAALLMSLPMIALPLAVYVFDPQEFNVQAAQMLIGLQLGWFTNR